MLSKRKLISIYYRFFNSKNGKNKKRKINKKSPANKRKRETTIILTPPPHTTVPVLPVWCSGEEERVHGFPQTLHDV